MKSNNPFADFGEPTETEEQNGGQVDEAAKNPFFFEEAVTEAETETNFESKNPWDYPEDSNVDEG